MTTNPIPITKDENQRLRWLLKATDKNADGARAALAGASIEHRATVATDGFRLQAIETPYHVREALQGTVNRFDDLQASSETVTPTPIEGQFPDYRVIMPKHAPVFEVALDGKLLREALEGMKGGINGKVRLRFYGPTQGVEVFGQANDESRAYALIMPMHPGHENGEPWRP